jgi:ferrous-iron efflux pump FieF
MAESSSTESVTKEKLFLVGIGVVTTFLSLIPTLYATMISNSVTLLSDSLRCGVEFLAIFLSWIVLFQISREDISRYNYGFGKLERFAGLAVGLALLVTFFITLSCSLHRLFYPAELHNTFFGFVFGVLSVLGNLFLWTKNHSFYRRHPSPVLDSQWRLFRAKTFATLVVAVSLGGEILLKGSILSVYLDPIGSFILSVFLLNSSLTLLSNSMADLLDRAVEERVQSIILKSLENTKEQHSGIRGVRSRRSGDNTYIDIFIKFSPDLLFSDVHERVMNIKCSLERVLPNSEVVVVPLLDAPGAYSCKLWSPSGDANLQVDL